MRFRTLLLWFTLLSGTISSSSAEDFRSYIKNSWDFHRVPQPPSILQSKHWNHWVLMPWRYRWGKEYDGQLAQRLKEAGFNGAMCDHSPQKAEIHEQAGLLWYLDHAAGKGDLYLYPENTTQEALRAPNRPVCLADPQVWARLRGRLDESLDDAREYNTRIAYALDDEVSWSSFTSPCKWDNSPATMADFHRWLTERYGHREAVMAQWGSSGEQFWERMATPDDFQDLYNRPWPQWNLSPWADALSYMDSQFNNLIGDLVTHANAVDGLTPTGIVGGQCPSPYGGYDYAKLMRKVQFLEAYDLGCSAEIARSLNPGNAIPLVKTGFGDPLDPHSIWFYWYYLAHGDRGLISWADGWFRDEGVPEERVLRLGGEIQKLSRSSEKIFSAKWLHDGVAIYYSHPSIQVSWFIDCETHGKTWINRSSSMNNVLASTVGTFWAWVKLLEDAGVQYNFYSYADLLEKGLDPHEYKVLILPRALALSDQEAEEMVKYVAAGGHLIADHSPGWFDQHLTGRARPVLDELFGIKTRPKARPGQFFGGHILAELDADRYYLLNFVEAGAMMWDYCRRQDGFVVAERDLPTFKERRHGAGWANLMNVSIMEYAFLRTFDWAEAKKYRAPIEKLLRRAGVKPWTEMRVKGKRPPRVEMTYWQKDDRVIVCIVRNPLVLAKGPVVGPEPDSFGETLKLTVIFDETKEDVVNERTETSLGNGSEFQIPWATQEAAMLSFRQ
ncbi:MAG: hypothetical protein AMJ92_10100 [candidate division Zixibacteria bacterium SM23_81]|nr:MAG: hypothetical protein AMJ92_10100 [candidate division Zixibacteria bacterium SM23_81]